MKETVYILVPVKATYTSQVAKRLALKKLGAMTKGMVAGGTAPGGSAMAEALRGEWLRNNLHTNLLLGEPKCKKQ